MRHIAIMCGTVLACSGSPSAAETLRASGKAAGTAVQRTLDEQAPQWLETYDVPSLAVAYIEDGALAWTAVYGEQSPGVAATDDTLYNIASMAKPISAETLLRLASKGEIALDEPMSAYWVDPDIKDNIWHRKLTPRIALSHRTGFPNWRRQTGDVLTFRWEPGTRTSYSGEGYEYAARFAERKTGRSFEELAREHVFAPIGMADTSYTGRDWFAGRVAVPQGPQGEPGEPDIAAEWIASDDVHATVSDYAKFLASVMNREALTPGIAAARVTISEDQSAMACGPEKIPAELCPESLGFGLGWAILDFGGETVVMQGGGDWGERTIGFYVPELGKGAVIFTNGANGSKVIRNVAGLLYANPGFAAFLDMQAR